MKTKLVPPALVGLGAVAVPFFFTFYTIDHGVFRDWVAIAAGVTAVGAAGWIAWVLARGRGPVRHNVLVALLCLIFGGYYVFYGFGGMVDVDASRATPSTGVSVSFNDHKTNKILLQGCVDKDNVELCKTSCDRGLQLGCSRYAIALFYGRGVAKDVARAADLVALACEKGISEACRNQGVLYRDGIHVAKDPARAAALFEKSCKLGWANGCFQAGILRHFGPPDLRELDAALRLYRRGCELHDPDSCNNLGSVLEKGDTASGSPDFEGAHRLYTKACTLGDMMACANQASLLVKGKGVERDVPKAVGLLERACTAEYAEGCRSLGALFSEDHVKDVVDIKRSGEMYLRGCELGLAKSCPLAAFRLLRGLGMAKAPAKALDLLRKACGQDHAWSCRMLGIVLRDGDGVPADSAQGHKYLSRACKLGDETACEQHAQRVSTSP